MALMAWNEAYGVGSAVLDSDHRILVNLLNQLHDAVETGQSHEVVATVVTVLAEYTEHHLRREESLRAATSGPEPAPHRDLGACVRQMRDRWLGGDRQALDDEVLERLKKWLTEHILGADKSYRPWIEGTAVRGGTVESH